MFPVSSLLTTVFLAISIVATPLEVRNTFVTLKLAKQINTDGGAVNLLHQDQARVAAFRQRGAAIQSGKLERRQGNEAATNVASSYVVSVGVGSPATYYNLVVDTGSSNTWVGAGTPYTPTSSSEDTGQAVSVNYGTEENPAGFSGEEWIDTVTLSPELVIPEQSIGVASSSSGFTGFDGIMGIGPKDLTEGTLASPWETIPTVTENLYSEGKIPAQLVGISFESTTSPENKNGELSFGGTDPSKYTGEINYTPITDMYPASNYWGINQSITYGSETLLQGAPGIVDTGTTLLLLASNAYTTYQSLTGAKLDQTTGWLTVSNSQYENLQNLDFHIGSVTYSLVPNAQIWPRTLNTLIGGSSGSIYLIVGSTGSPSGSGLDFTNGQVFLERFYSVFDTTNAQVGFATTQFTYADSVN